MPADRGGHRDHLLVVDLELGAERPEERRRLGALRLGRLGRRVPDGHPLAEAGRGVRHAADDLVVAEDPGQRRRGRPGEDAQDELAAAEVRADLAPDPAEHLGLDPEQDDVGALDGLDVARDGPDPVLALEVLAALGARMAGDDLPGLDELAAEQAGDHRLGHDAGADGRDRGLREGGHRPEYSARRAIRRSAAVSRPVRPSRVAEQEEPAGRRDLDRLEAGAASAASSSSGS